MIRYIPAADAGIRLFTIVFSCLDYARNDNLDMKSIGHWDTYRVDRTFCGANWKHILIIVLSLGEQYVSQIIAFAKYGLNSGLWCPKSHRNEYTMR